MAQGQPISRHTNTNKKTMNYMMIYISVLVLLLSCSEGKPQEGKLETIQSVEKASASDTIHFLLENGEYGKSWLDIIADHESNEVIFLTRRDDWILSISGYGNTELVLTESGEAVVDTIDFGKDGMAEYVYRAFIRGSTYGAYFSYIVYANNEWEVFRVPFDRSIVRYDEGSNDYLIVTYHNNDSTIYKFDAGILTPL
jgi:hypothetical protein